MAGGFYRRHVTGSCLPGATITTLVVISFIWYALTQFGVLSAAALLYVVNVVEAFPSPFSRSVWYAESALVAVLGVVMLAVYAFHTTVAGRPLWRPIFDVADGRSAT